MPLFTVKNYIIRSRPTMKWLPHRTSPHGTALAMIGAKPGERVRIYFLNANINLPVALHPIASIWDRVYINGNPKNTLYGIQTYNVAVAEADTFDMVMPVNDKAATGIAIVDHSMGAALRGAISVLVSKKDADPAKGHGEMIILK